MKKLAFILWALICPQLAFAQGNPVVTSPYAANSITNSSSTIAVTNTFQSIWVASIDRTGRVACTVQNTGTNPMYVFFGPIADATIAKSVKLTAGQAATCNNGPVVLRQQVSITGTATETFYAAQN